MFLHNSTTIEEAFVFAERPFRDHLLLLRARQLIAQIQTDGTPG